MKKLALVLMTALMVLAFSSSHLKAETVTGEVTLVASKPDEAAEAKVLLTRLEVIKTMDMSTLSSIEKRNLRKEVRSIKATLREMDGTIIYISAGGLIIVLLLIILLL